MHTRQLVHVYASIIYVGQSLLEGHLKTSEDEVSGNDTSFNVSKMDTKIIANGPGSTLHQMTRSRQLVSLFHKSGHTISYKDVLLIDT